MPISLESLTRPGKLVVANGICTVLLIIAKGLPEPAKQIASILLACAPDSIESSFLLFSGLNKVQGICSPSITL